MAQQPQPAAITSTSLSELDAWKARIVSDIQFEIERRVSEAVPPYTVTKAMRRAIRILAKGSGLSNAERTELQAIDSTFATMDAIEAAGQAAKDRVNAQTSIPADEVPFLQW